MSVAGAKRRREEPPPPMPLPPLDDRAGPTVQTRNRRRLDAEQKQHQHEPSAADDGSPRKKRLRPSPRDEPASVNGSPRATRHSARIQSRHDDPDHDHSPPPMAVSPVPIPALISVDRDTDSEPASGHDDPQLPPKNGTNHTENGVKPSASPPHESAPASSSASGPSPAVSVKVSPTPSVRGGNPRGNTRGRGRGCGRGRGSRAFTSRSGRGGRQQPTGCAYSSPSPDPSTAMQVQTAPAAPVSPPAGLRRLRERQRELEKAFRRLAGAQRSALAVLAERSEAALVTDKFAHLGPDHAIVIAGLQDKLAARKGAVESEFYQRAQEAKFLHQADCERVWKRFQAHLDNAREEHILAAQGAYMAFVDKQRAKEYDDPKTRLPLHLPPVQTSAQSSSDPEPDSVRQVRGYNSWVVRDPDAAALVTLAQFGWDDFVQRLWDDFFPVGEMQPSKGETTNDVPDVHDATARQATATPAEADVMDEAYDAAEQPAGIVEKEVEGNNHQEQTFDPLATLLEACRKADAGAITSDDKLNSPVNTDTGASEPSFAPTTADASLAALADVAVSSKPSPMPVPAVATAKPSTPLAVTMVSTTPASPVTAATKTPATAPASVAASNLPPPSRSEHPRSPHPSTFSSSHTTIHKVSGQQPLPSIRSIAGVGGVLAGVKQPRGPPPLKPPPISGYPVPYHRQTQPQDFSRASPTHPPFSQPPPPLQPFVPLQAPQAQPNPLYPPPQHYAPPPHPSAPRHSPSRPPSHAHHGSSGSIGTAGPVSAHHRQLLPAYPYPPTIPSLAEVRAGIPAHPPPPDHPPPRPHYPPPPHSQPQMPAMHMPPMQMHGPPIVQRAPQQGSTAAAGPAGVYGGGMYPGMNMVVHPGIIHGLGPGSSTDPPPGVREPYMSRMAPVQKYGHGPAPPPPPPYGPQPPPSPYRAPPPASPYRPSGQPLASRPWYEQEHGQGWGPGPEQQRPGPGLTPGYFPYWY